MSEPIGPEEEVYMTSHDASELLARTSDYLYTHSQYSHTEPEMLPPEVTDYIMHTSEHLLRYIGVLPAQEPFMTGHLNSQLMACDDNYMPYMSPDEVDAHLREFDQAQEKLHRLMLDELGIHPDEDTK